MCGVFCSVVFKAHWQLLFVSTWMVVCVNTIKNKRSGRGGTWFIRDEHIFVCSWCLPPQKPFNLQRLMLLLTLFQAKPVAVVAFWSCRLALSGLWKPTAQKRVRYLKDGRALNVTATDWAQTGVCVQFICFTSSNHEEYLEAGRCLDQLLQLCLLLQLPLARLQRHLHHLYTHLDSPSHGIYYVSLTLNTEFNQ